MLGNTPFINRGGQVDPSKLFYSKQELAFTKGIAIPGGFGLIKSGSIMAKITESTGRLGQYVPYSPEDPVAALADCPGLAYIVADGTAAGICYVTMADSYKFAVGDHLGAGDSDGSQVDLGAVSAIDRTTNSHMAKLTFANDITTGITVANGGAVWIQSATASPFVKAVGVLYASVETGEGENAKGGQGVLILSNAMLYKDLLYNYDSEVLTDLGASVDGRYLIL